MQAALQSLPATLDATYERILTGIEELLREEALILLRWLAYAQSPPSLGELAEATIIDPKDAGGVDIDNRGDIEDTLDILSGLITLESAERNNDNSDSIEDENGNSELDESEPEYGVARTASQAGQFGRDTKVRLAHFSVKEYLESKRILQGNAKNFYLEIASEHEYLAQSCLMYLVHYSGSNEKRSTIDDLEAFPLLRYAARSWFYHSSLQQSTKVNRETCFLSSETVKVDWLQVHEPDRYWRTPFRPTVLRYTGPGLYYASFLGLEAVVSAFLKAGADVNAHGGRYGNALQAASSEGHEKVVQMLMDAGADINAQGGFYGNALQVASARGHEKVVQILLEAGAEVNARGGFYGNALQAVSAEGNEKVVQMLIDAGADINAQGGEYGNALQAASARGHEKVVQILIATRADINTQGGEYGNALQAASQEGYENIVQILINTGADITARGGFYGNALQAASARGHEKVVQILLEAGAEVNATGRGYGNALLDASDRGHEKLVTMLLERRPDVKANPREDRLGNALLAASFKKVVEVLLERGVDFYARDYWDNALHAASRGGNEERQEESGEDAI